MRTPDPVQNELIRDEILRGAKELFQNYGLSKTTMEDIADAAGKGKSTLYYYFKRKEDVFHAVAKSELADIMETIGKSIKHARTAKEKLSLFFTTHSNAIRTKAKLYPIIFKETKKHIHFFHRIQREINSAEVKILNDILLEGISSGEFKNIKRDNSDTIAIVAITALHGMDINLLLDGKMPSAEARLSAIIDIFVRGIE